MLSPDLQRLKHIRDYCDAVEKTIARYGNSFETYRSDPDYQRSICFSIFQIGELSGGLSEEYRKSTAANIQWGPMKAMRNLVVHSYGKVDHEVVWETATVDIPALRKFCEKEISEQK